MEQLNCKNLTINFLTQQITVDSEEVKLDPKAFSTLKLLIENKDRVVHNDELIKEVWDNREINNEVVVAAVARIRKIFKQAGVKRDVIKTVHKVGYQFVLKFDKADTGLSLLNNKKHIALASLLIIISLLSILWLNLSDPKVTINQQPPIAQVKLSKPKDAFNKHTRIFFVRHADKASETEDPHLSDLGKKRALYWKNFLKDIPFDEVYITDFHRSVETASILSSLTPKYYSALSFDIVKHAQEHSGQSILIIGHSNTIPDMVNRLLPEPTYPPMSHRNYNLIYQVVIDSQGNTSSFAYNLDFSTNL